MSYTFSVYSKPRRRKILDLHDRVTGSFECEAFAIVLHPLLNSWASGTEHGGPFRPSSGHLKFYPYFPVSIYLFQTFED